MKINITNLLIENAKRLKVETVDGRLYHEGFETFVGDRTAKIKIEGKPYWMLVVRASDEQTNVHLIDCESGDESVWYVNDNANKG